MCALYQWVIYLCLPESVRQNKIFTYQEMFLKGLWRGERILESCHGCVLGGGVLVWVPWWVVMGMGVIAHSTHQGNNCVELGTTASPFTWHQPTQMTQFLQLCGE